MNDMARNTINKVNCERILELDIRIKECESLIFLIEGGAYPSVKKDSIIALLRARIRDHKESQFHAANDIKFEL